MHPDQVAITLRDTELSLSSPGGTPPKAKVARSGNVSWLVFLDDLVGTDTRSSLAGV